ncbi:hypothetical protein IWZ03DRAFT_390906 [Phyllosticta citriasiana]|uniref:Uncharacterized protein n=1 Tax=Phyllosticta citriasiana TaxID=595635 RepID=A0ABR1KD71_9PEZI
MNVREANVQKIRQQCQGPFLFLGAIFRDHPFPDIAWGSRDYVSTEIRRWMSEHPFDGVDTGNMQSLFDLFNIGTGSTSYHPQVIEHLQKGLVRHMAEKELPMLRKPGVVSANTEVAHDRLPMASGKEETYGDMLENEAQYHQWYLEAKTAFNSLVQRHGMHFADFESDFIRNQLSSLEGHVVQLEKTRYNELEEQVLASFKAMLFEYRRWQLQITSRKALEAEHNHEHSGESSGETLIL